MPELWIFLNRLSKQGIRRTKNCDGQDYTAASLLSFFSFAKLARMKIEEALGFLSSNNFNRFFGDLIARITDRMNFEESGITH